MTTTDTLLAILAGLFVVFLLTPAIMRGARKKKDRTPGGGR